MSEQPVSHVIDDGKTRFVAVVERSRAVIHATKYGDRETVLVTIPMSASEARELGLWLVENTKGK